MRFWVTVRKLNVTDGWTDRRMGGVAISLVPGPTTPTGDKNYTAHPHDMVHVPVKFLENTAMSFWVTVQKLNVTDRQTRQTDGWTDKRGAFQYLLSRAFVTAGDNNWKPVFHVWAKMWKKEKYIFGCLRGPSIIRVGYLANQLSSHPYLCTCEVRK